MTYTFAQKPQPEDLNHYGTKGMKWGVRKDRGHVGERAKTKKIEKLDRKFIQDAHSPRTIIALHNAAAEKTNSRDVDRINNKYRADLDKGMMLNDTPQRRRYYEEHRQAFLKNVREAAVEHGTNASGTMQYSIMDTGRNGEPGGGWDILVTEVKHADGEEVLFHVDLDVDKRGAIVGIVLPEGSLTHYGVKGMRWGVRRARRDAVIERVARGQGSRLDKARTLGRASAIDLIRGRGLQGAAQLKSNRNRARAERFAKGEATARDILVRVGSMRYTDLVPTRERG